MVLATGWTWEYVWENMTLQRLEVMKRLWDRCPPANVSLAKLSMMLAAFLGVKESPRALPSSAQQEIPEFVILPDFEE